MKKQLFFILLLFGLSGISLKAQEKLAFMGEVRDSLGAPLEFANVMAMDTVKNTIASFGVTNNTGAFRINLIEGKVYKLKVSFIGYLPFEKVFTARDTGGVPVLITLSNDVTQLDAVEVVTEMAVLIQGDTITYKTDVFTQGNERKLGDVLEDLPGFEVNENGEVSVQGKRVSKVLVDGKELFDGDTKLATKNLPANVVDKVQVLQNYNDIGPLSGVNNSQQLALNIQLKEDKKRIVFGDLTAGGGPQDRYRAHANIFYYDPKVNINFIGDANNVGELAFTMGDYFRFGAGLGSLASRSGSNFRVSNNQGGVPMAQRNSAQDLNNQFGALNYNLTPNARWRFSGFAIGSKVDNNLGSIQQRTYILQPGDNQEELSSQQNVKSTGGLLKFTAKYLPNPNLHLDYSLFGKLSNIRNTSDQTSQFTGFTNDILRVNSQDPWAIEQQLRAFYAPDDKNVLSFESSYKISEQDLTYDLATTQQPFASIIPLQGSVDGYNLVQLKDVATTNQEAALNYYRILNKTNHINFKIGNSYTSQTLNSNLLERMSDGTDNAIADMALTNLVDYTFQDYYVGVLFKTKLGKLVLTPALNLHYYDIENVQNGVSEGFSKTLLLPSLDARYEFRRSHSLTIKYDVNAEFTDVKNVARGIIVTGYNSLFGGNPTLQNNWYHRTSVNYSNFNMFNNFNVYGGLNYQKRFDDITNIIQFNGLERINSPINIDPANEILTGFANLSKRFSGFRVSGSGNWTRSVTNNRISDIDNENVSFQQRYKAAISSTLRKGIYLDVAYEVSFNKYAARFNTSKFENHRPSAGLEIEFLKSFNLDIDYEYNNYRNQTNGTESNYDLLNAKLIYRKDKSPWEFRVEGMNLMNTTGIRRDSFSESLISTYEYFIQKRYWLFSVMYDL